MLRYAMSLSIAVWSASGVRAAEPVPAVAAKISYHTQVRPLFQQNCQGCHQPARSLGGYLMTTHAELFKKGDRDKPGVVAGKPELSFLLEQIRAKDGKAEMPKAKEPLPEAQYRIIQDWIVQGAIDDTPASATAALVDAEHPPVYQSMPVIPSLAFSPDGQTLAIAGYHEVLLHKGDGTSTAPIGRLIGLSERIQSLAFSPDGKLLAVSGGDPSRFGELQIWDVAKQKLRVSIPVTSDTVYGVSWSPDGTRVACGCADNTIRAFDIKTGQQVLFGGAHADWVMATAFSQDGQHLVSVSRDRSVKLTEVTTQRFVDNVTSITPGALKGGLLAIDLRPTKTKTMAKPAPDTPGAPPRVYDELLVAGADGVPRLYKMHREAKRVIGDDANRVREYERLPGRIYSLKFNREGNLFAAGSSLDGTGELRVYEVDSGKRVSKFEGVTTPIYAVSFHPEGKVVASAGFDGLVRLNDPMTGKLIKEFAPIAVGKK